MSDILEIAAYPSTFDADVAIAHLASEGIEAFLASDDAGGAFPSMTGIGGGARVLVRSADADAARAALATLDQPAD
jgi:Putative prokaryotic signal transducing protein